MLARRLSAYMTARHPEDALVSSPARMTTRHTVLGAPGDIRSTSTPEEPSGQPPVTCVDFERFRSGETFKYRCTLCKGRAMNSIDKHKGLPNHIAMIAAQEAAVSENQHHLGSFLQNDEMNSSDKGEEGQDEEMINSDQSSPACQGYTEALMQLLTGNYGDSGSKSERSDSEESEQHGELADANWDAILMNKLQDDIDRSSSTLESQSSDSGIDDNRIEEATTRDTPRIDTDWYPFTKEQIVGLLSAGSGRRLVSETEYERNRSLFGIFNISLPAYRTLGRLRKRICARLGFNIQEWESALQNPCYGLSIKEIVAQELANPVVIEHLTFIPECDLNKPINRLSQSKKWCEGFSRDQRLPMVSSTKGHFFVYEPVRQASGEWIVPIFFFQRSGKIYAKCVKASIISQIENSSDIKIIVSADQEFNSPLLITVEMDTIMATFMDSMDNEEHDGDGYREIPLPNPWRMKANGKVIRHVPITLYSDDTSGNVSKKWNKHMSYYFTLSGLPPGMTNQEYNIHFLLTSNKASALELGENVVTELNVETLSAKQDAKYTRAFVGVHQEEGGPKPREWSITKSQTHELWELLQNPKKHAEFLRKSKEYGVKDTTNHQFVGKFHELHRDNEYSKEEVHKMFIDLNDHFGDRLFNPFLKLEGFEGHLDIPVESLHVVLLGVVKYLFRDAMDNLPDSALPSVLARWKSFDTSGLNVPPIQPKTLTSYYQSLVGKDFQTILQSVPFVLYPHFSYERRRMWTALVHLGSYIFQTEITHMRTYLENLKKLVNIFLGHLIRWTAQWTNKPKFHMLVHLVQSIDRFGPLSLVATQKFESFNGILRIASIHTNRHNPGLHIARIFLYARMLRHLCSGGSFWDHKNHCQARAGKKLIKLFTKYQWVQKLFSYNIDWNSKGHLSMKGKCEKNASGTPSELKEGFPDHIWTPKSEAVLASKQRVHLQNFVLIDLKSSDSPRVGRVESFWEGLTISQEDLWISIRDIKSVLNVQHNCHRAKCQPQKSPRKHNGQLPVESPYQMQHEAFNGYLINSGALYSAESHRSIAKINYKSWTIDEWEECIQIGMDNWKSTREKKEQSKQDQVAKNTKKKEKENAKKRKNQDINQCEDIDPALYH
ncbi:hypothetical protein DFH28DRAFT_926198 [Melampsora americana]|nr:hypothetical protein DFH28DRAFT_926198 [Melampsora americana]